MQCSSKSHKLKSCLKSCAYFPLGAVLLYILHNNRLKKTSLFAKKKKKMEFQILLKVSIVWYL